MMCRGLDHQNTVLGQVVPYLYEEHGQNLPNFRSPRLPRTMIPERVRLDVHAANVELQEEGITRIHGCFGGTCGRQCTG